MCRLGGFFTKKIEEGLDSEYLLTDCIAGFGIQNDELSAPFGFVCGTGYWTKGATIGATIYGR
jgi:hypothetical protein